MSDKFSRQPVTSAQCPFAQKKELLLYQAGRAQQTQAAVWQCCLLMLIIQIWRSRRREIDANSCTRSNISGGRGSGLNEQSEWGRKLGGETRAEKGWERNLEIKMETAVKSNYEHISQLGKPATSHTRARLRALLFQGDWSRLRGRKKTVLPAACLWLWGCAPRKENSSWKRKQRHFWLTFSIHSMDLSF